MGRFVDLRDRVRRDVRLLVQHRGNPLTSSRPRTATPRRPTVAGVPGRGDPGGLHAQKVRLLAATHCDGGGPPDRGRSGSLVCATGDEFRGPRLRLSRPHRPRSPHDPISPCLWFDNNLEEAAKFYTSIFPNSSVGHVTRYNGGPRRPGSAMAGEFELDGLTFRGITAVPPKPGSPRRSRSASTAGPGRGRLLLGLPHRRGRGVGVRLAEGPLRGVWQVVPIRLYELVSDPDPARARAATEAMIDDAQDRHRRPRSGRRRGVAQPPIGGLRAHCEGRLSARASEPGGQGTRPGLVEASRAGG